MLFLKSLNDNKYGLEENILLDKDMLWILEIFELFEIGSHASEGNPMKSPLESNFIDSLVKY